MKGIEDSPPSITNSCPPEIWSQIFYCACTDTGFTGRSISATSRYFHEIAKKVRLRSVALFSIEQIIDFVKFVEALPLEERLVENLYITTHSSFRHDESRIITSEFYKPGFDTRVEPPSKIYQEILHNYYELRRHCLMRTLYALAPTLKHLHIDFDGTRDFLLPPVDLSQLEELVVEGCYSYGNKEFANERLPVLRSLRRLRLTRVHATRGESDNTLRTVVFSAPNLTHLRLDHYVYSSRAHDAIQKFLPPEPILDGSPSAARNLSGNEQFPPRGMKTFPRSLRKMLLHPGPMRTPWQDGSSGSEQTDLVAFQHIVFVDPRIKLFKQALFTTGPTERPKRGLTEWMDRINGKESYWSTNDEPPAAIVFQ